MVADSTSLCLPPHWWTLSSTLQECLLSICKPPPELPHFGLTCHAGTKTAVNAQIDHKSLPCQQWHQLERWAEKSSASGMGSQVVRASLPAELQLLWDQQGPSWSRCILGVLLLTHLKEKVMLILAGLHFAINWRVPVTLSCLCCYWGKYWNV